ncbi:extracellular solute-binding protein [Vibrio sp. JC009]|uniref:extracellular solute-binding protein n=1 Tax=Vibrio sp. JC009 TaxID=2912314 RepID=UPI0023AF18F9|nr:extracellular solute-binding protein [Vibrio sp. JC009]WED24817.1 extracellular solute-binding protein [Vibrio sp. JC009]
MNRFSVLFLLFLLTAQVFASEEPLKIVTFNSPPYSMLTKGRHEGYATEIVRAMLMEMQQNVPITSYPLKRGLYFAQNNQNTLVYPIARYSNLDDRFHWIGEISQTREYLFRHKLRPDIQLTNLNDAKKYIIGVTRGSHIIEKLTGLGFHRLREVTDATQNILMLNNNRVDLIASDDLMLSHLVDRYNRNKETKLDLHDYQKLAQLPKSKSSLYIALSKNSTPEMVSSVENAYRTIQESGKLIEVAHWWTNEHDAPMLAVYQNAIAMKGYQWVDYTIEGAAGGNMTEVLRSRASSHRLPQAIQTYMGPAVREWAEKEALLFLDDVAESEGWQSVLPEIIDKNIRYNGHYVAVPVNLQRVNWMWVNPEIFKRAGAKLPHSWEEFFHAANLIKKAGYTPVAMGGYAWQEGTLFESLVLSIGGADFYTRLFVELDAEAFRSPTMAKILDTFRKIESLTDGDINRRERNWVQATEMLINKQAAIYFMGDWIQTVFQDHNFPYGQKGYICMPLPGGDELFLANADAFAFPKTDKPREQGSKALAKVMMEQDVQEQFNLIKGSIPARLDVPLNKFDECSLISARVAKEGTMVPSFNFNQAQPAAIQQPVTAIISDFFRSNKSISQIQETLYRAVTKYKSSNKNRQP